jgi:hypothetical protein
VKFEFELEIFTSFVNLKMLLKTAADEQMR